MLSQVAILALLASKAPSLVDGVTSVQLSADALSSVRSTYFHDQINRGNVCKQGKLLPELYLLGAKNTASSSLSQDLRDRGILAAPDGQHGKEWNYLKGLQDNAGGISNLSPSVVESGFYDALLPCPSDDVHTTVADFSVMNAAFVDVSPRFQHSGKWENETFNTPLLVSELYGKLSSQLKFTLTVREPLSRTQSEYYHTLPLGNCPGCMLGSSFNESIGINVEIASNSTPTAVTDWLMKSLYAVELEEWLKYFDAQQFLVIPYRQYTDNTMETSALLSEFFDYPMDAWAEASHGNSHEHPLLEDDISAENSAAFQELFADENQRFVEVLAEAQVNGLLLANYEGSEGSKEEISQWLQDSW